MFCVLFDQRHRRGVGRVGFVDQDQIRTLEVDPAREVFELVAGTMRIGERNPQIGFIKRRVVVAAVPDDDVGFLFGAFEYCRVIDAGIHDHPVFEMRLVFFALLDRTRGEVIVFRKSLYRLAFEITVRHRVPHRDDTFAPGFE